MYIYIYTYTDVKVYMKIYSIHIETDKVYHYEQHIYRTPCVKKKEAI